MPLRRSGSTGRDGHRDRARSGPHFGAANVGGNQLLKSDGFSTSMNLKPWFSTRSKEVVCQNSLTKNFPLGSPSGTMVHTYRSRGGPIMLYFTWLPKPVTNWLHVLRPMFDQGVDHRSQLMVVGLPSHLPGKGDHHRVGAAGSAPYCRVASASAADRRLLELADTALVVCGSSHRHSTSPGGWCVLSGS